MKNLNKSISSDRLIPVRSLSAPRNAIFNTLYKRDNQNKEEGNLPNSTGSKNKVLTFNKSVSTRDQTNVDFLSTLHNTKKTLSKILKSVDIDCFKTIDVPEVVDNFYCNLIDISKSDFIAIGLGSSLFTYREDDNNSTSFINKYRSVPITSVKYSIEDSMIITGNQDGSAQVYDIESVRAIRYIKNHSYRIGRLQTNIYNPSIFFSGSFDGFIHVNDMRQKIPSVKKFKTRDSSSFISSSQVCGLSFKENLLASGSADGRVRVWDMRNDKITNIFTHHTGAVKALSWCPWKTDILVSGGGKKDQKITVLDVNNNSILHTIQVNHQITDLCMRSSTQQIVYSYGKQQKGSIRTNNYFNPKCQNKKLKSYKQRVLCLKLSKKRQNILCSLSADECIRYWDLDSVGNKLQADDVFVTGVLEGL